MNIIPYPSYAKPTICKCQQIIDDISIRSRLTVNIGGTQGSIAFIMMNPSKADFEQSDITVNKILNFSNKLRESKELSFNKVNIVNLFPIYKTESSLLYRTLMELKSAFPSREYLTILNKGCKEIQECLLESNYIVFAWGDNPSKFPKGCYDQQISKVLKIVKKCKKDNLFVLKTQYKSTLTQKQQPRHPNRNKILGIVSCKLSKTGNLDLIEE
jgi:hypothetical protein